MQVSVRITSDVAEVFLDGILQAVFRTHFPATGRVGVAVVNGYSNTVFFHPPEITRRTTQAGG